MLINKHWSKILAAVFQMFDFTLFQWETIHIFYLMHNYKNPFMHFKDFSTIYLTDQDKIRNNYEAEWHFANINLNPLYSDGLT